MKPRAVRLVIAIACAAWGILVDRANLCPLLVMAALVAPSPWEVWNGKG
jgi:hypothetical protein